MRRKFVFPIVLILAMLCLALGIYIASQPVVSCGTAAKNPTLKAPAALNSAQDYLAQGDYDFEHGACDQAITDYTRAIELNPNFAEGYNSRAYIYMVQKKYAAALPDLDSAIQLRPGYVNALMNRGDIYNYYYEIDHERAVADYDQVLKADASAASRTSVCGHRLLALNHGWNLKVLGTLLTVGVKAGCPNSTP